MAVGDVFKKRRNLVQQSAAPAVRNAMNYYPGHPDYVPSKPPTYQERYRMANGQNPGNANFIYGVDDRDENGNPMRPQDAIVNLQNTPRSFNPQNQDVLARAAAALDAVKQDRLNPMYGGAQGYAAPGQNAAIQGSPGLRGFVDSVGKGIGSLFNHGGSSPMYGGAQGYAAPGANGAGVGTAPDNSPESIYYRGQAASMTEQAQGMRGLAGKIDALRQRSQQANPMAPQAPAYDPMQAEIDRGTRQGNIMFEPGATSSNGATRNFRKIAPDELNSTTAGTVNGYNGQMGYAQNPMRLRPEEKLNLAEGNARRIVGGGAAADPTNMRGRFGGAYGAGLDADAAAIASGTAVRLADGTVVRHTGTQESARAAQVAGKTEREALRDRSNMNVPQAELDRRAAADAQKAARAAKHQAFKDANGGMSYRQYDRMTGSSSGNNALTMKAVREGRLSPEEANYRMQLRAEKALRRSGNPITGGTSQAGRFFPDQVAAARGGQNQAGSNPIAAAAANKFMPGGIVTPDSKQAAQDTLKVLAEGGKAPDGTPVPPSPMFAGLASSPDNIQGLHFGIQQMVQDGQDLGPNELQNLHAAVVAMQAGYGTSSYDPFDMTYGFEGLSDVDQKHTEVFSPMYKQLAGMKAPTDEALLGWWQSFKGNISADTSVWDPSNKPTFSWGHEYPKQQGEHKPWDMNTLFNPFASTKPDVPKNPMK